MENADKIKMLEETLRESENKFRLLAENASDNIWTMDLDGRLTFVSQSIYKIRGFTSAEAMAQSMEEVIAPDSLATVFAKLEEINTSVRLGLPVENIRAELELLCKDGSTVWTEVNINGMYDSDGAFIQLVGVTRDISERKRTETELRKLSRVVEQSPVSIMITDVYGTLEFVNPMFSRLTGYSAEEAIGQNPRMLKSGNTPAETHRNLWLTISAGNTWEGEFHNKGKDGTLFWEHAVISPLRDTAGVVTHYLAVKENITEKKSIMAQLVAAKEQAESANRAKSVFLSNMSHEIRTPMNGVMGMIQLIELTDMSEEQQEYVISLKSSGKNLLSLVNDILDLSKIEAGRISIATAEFELYQAIQDVYLMQKSVMFAKNLKFNIDFAEDFPVLVEGDQLRVKQIMLNLIGNAVKFTAQGSITISVQVLEKHHRQITAQISVTDTGTGISAEALDNIFKPFVQEDGGITRRFGGTGLGLTISRRLAEHMGGNISVESTPGVGSSFKLVIPFAIPLDSEKRVETVQNSEVEKDSVPLRILLVEDNPVNMKFIRALLGKHGHLVTTAENGRESLAALERDRFDLVLMDVQMPVMNGEETLCEIRRKESGTSSHQMVIAVTANALHGEKKQYLEAGFDGYISKPIGQKELLNEMKRVILLRAAHNSES